MNKAGGARIKCQCKLGEDSTEATWLNIDVSELAAFSDFMNLRFVEFYVTNDTGQEVDGSICIEECGVRLVSVEELDCFAGIGI